MRKEAWTSILDAEIEAARDKTFGWGVHDCSLWVGRVVHAISDIDHVLLFEGKYTSEAEAKELLREACDGGIVKYLNERLKAIPVPTAQRGDVVYDAKSGAIGICMGRNSFFVSREGLMTLATMSLKRAWKVD
jgi:hypothetical protein